MAINHRKLLQEQDPTQTIDCSDCSTCPYDCDFAGIYWPPLPPPPPTTKNDSSTTHISPYVIVIVALLASAILFISYYVIMRRYCVRFRQPQVNEEPHDFMNEDQQPEIDHPIWYINTIGLQPAVIRSIAVVKFKKGESSIDVTDCSVCLSEFEDDESLRLLPKCNHAFHIPCIDTWLRSHTNCPLCRASVLSNNSDMISPFNVQNENHGFGLNQNIHIENRQDDGELGSNRVQDVQIRESMRGTGNGVEVEDGSKETQNSKTEIETFSRLRRSFSMDSAAEIVHTELNSSSSTIEIQSSNHIRDSRTRSMVPMRSFSYGGRSNM